uniref:Uncharacterized protein n=1 Tax=Neospora caninum (strain Liverpool) TaxID=572307 RepID=A0A0F7UMR2_NEOCL|nr:TPA: hypothetical protein BN1204_055010 [Neospora caninum Liverpool]
MKMAEHGTSTSSKKKRLAVYLEHTSPSLNTGSNAPTPEDAQGDTAVSCGATSGQGQRVQIVAHAVKALFQRSKASRCPSSPHLSLNDDATKPSKPSKYGKEDSSTFPSAASLPSDGTTSSDEEGITSSSRDASQPISSSGVSTLLWARSLFGEEEEELLSNNRVSTRTLLVGEGQRGDSTYEPSKATDHTQVNGQEHLAERVEKMKFRSLKVGPASVGGLHIPVIATSLDLHIAPFWRTGTEQEARAEWRKTRAALRSDFKRKHKTAVRSLKGNNARVFQRKGGSAVSVKVAATFEKPVSFTAF